jgi:hypothetical protein
MMFRLPLGLLLAMLVLAVSSGPGGSRTAPVPPPPPPPPRWEVLLTWLPEDTETLIVAPGPFEIPKRGPAPAPVLFDFSKAIRFLPVLPLLLLHDELLRNELAGQKVLCAVEGSRRFTRPGEFGLMPYEGCHILQFDPASDDTLRKAVQACQKKAKETIEVAGERVAVFTEKRECDPWTFFVCRPRPGVLICATNRGYLEETLRRIDRKPGTRALPGDLPEWKHVDVKAPVWGIRHYWKELAAEDPSSPLHPDGDDPAAVGLAFSFGPGNGGRVRYLSGARDALEIATKGWDIKSEGLSPEIKPVAPGVIEITVSIPPKEESAAMFMFVLMLRLGHGIVV